MLTVYLAGRYSRRAELREYAAELAACGVGRVQARWLSETHDWDGVDAAHGARLAIDDVQDMAAANLVVVFTEPPGGCRRGGRHVEYGMALQSHLSYGEPRLVVVGPVENVFHTLVPRFASWGDLLRELTSHPGSVTVPL